MVNVFNLQNNKPNWLTLFFQYWIVFIYYFIYMTDFLSNGK
jgi:hypothetical protein